MAVYKRYDNAGYLYGDVNRLYGHGESGNLIWKFEVDWDGDGVFDGGNEAERVTAFSTKRGRKFFMKLSDTGEAIGFQPVSVGSLTFTLNNSDDRYNAWNTSSPIYPDVSPNKDVRVTISNGSPIIEYPVFYGVIDKITPNRKDKTVKISCSGTMKFLTKVDASVLMQTAITKSDAIDEVLDDVGWKSRWGRSIDSSLDVLPYWWAKNRALSELTDLAESGLGVMFGDARGRAAFYSRSHVSAISLRLTQKDLLKDVEFPQPYETTRNRIRVYANTYKIQSTSILWAVGEEVELTAGEEREIWATYTYNNAPSPADNVIQPVATTDYSMWSGSGGTGTDLTADFSIESFTDFGESAKLTIKNTGASTGYVSFLQIRGDAIIKTSATFAEETSGSGESLFTLDLKQLQNIHQASDFAVWLLESLGTDTMYPRIQIRGRADTQFVADLFDTINLSLDEMGLPNTAYRVGYIEHKSMSDNLQDVLTTIHLEPYRIVEGYWTFPAQIGIDTIFGV